MSKRTKRINLLLEILLWVLSVLTIYPILMILITSFKTKGEASYMSISLPKVWQFGNYAEVVRVNFLGSLFNSVVIVFISVILIIGFSSVVSYIIVRRDSKFCRVIYRVLSLAIIAPFAAMPTIQLLKTLHLYGSRIGLCFVYSVLYMPFSVMMITSFIKGIPRELDEAAVMDGAVGFKLFRKIIMPLLKPVIATTGVLNFMWVWNELQIPMYLLNSSSKWTLPLSVYNFYGQFSRSWNLVCADVILVSLPVILLYIFAQRFIIDGMTAGAVKG